MYYNFARGHQTLRVMPAMEAAWADHSRASRKSSVSWTDRPKWRREREKMTTDKQAEWWVGFACKQCGAPFAVQRSQDASKSGTHSAKGWRVTCTSCGVTEYYEPGTPMLRMAVSN